MLPWVPLLLDVGLVVGAGSDTGSVSSGGWVSSVSSGVSVGCSGVVSGVVSAGGSDVVGVWTGGSGVVVGSGVDVSAGVDVLAAGVGSCGSCWSAWGLWQATNTTTRSKASDKLYTNDFFIRFHPPFFNTVFHISTVRPLGVGSSRPPWALLGSAETTKAAQGYKSLHRRKLNTHTHFVLDKTVII